MNMQDFIAKIKWEGGVIDALDYGLSSEDLDVTDETSRKLVVMWYDAEIEWSSLASLIGEIDELIYEYEGE